MPRAVRDPGRAFQGAHGRHCAAAPPGHASRTDHVKAHARITRSRRKAATAAEVATTPLATVKQAPAPARAYSMPKKIGAMTRAIVLMALSIPMTVPRRLGGTHCNSIVGTVGPKRGTPTW
mmetsp:Transcript_58016/g.172485  ORF Transcript_58016/g.172485 Transcript_58016/m.172485 type:complete len:121 (-) Transcript_58016:70-432(-)